MTNAKKSSAKALAKKQDENNEVAVFDETMFEADAGVGQENIGVENMAIPRITIIQSGSPQAKKGDPKFIEGCEASDFLNSVNNDTYNGEEGLMILPLSFQLKYIEWDKRKEQGGLDRGLMADHGTDDSILQKCEQKEGKYHVIGDTTIITPTPEYFVFVVNKETGDHFVAVISMSNSGYQVSKKFNTMMRDFKLPSGNSYPSFARLYNLSTVYQTDKSGNTWYNWAVKPDVMITDVPNGVDIYQKAREMHKLVSSQEMNVSPHVSETITVEDENSPV